MILIAIAAVHGHELPRGLLGAASAGGSLEVVVAIAIIVGVAAANVRGLTAERLRAAASGSRVVDIVLQVPVIVLGLALLFNLDTVARPDRARQRADVERRRSSP